MSTTRTTPRDLALGTAPGRGEPPPLSAVDRVALRLGTALILRGPRRVEAAERAEHARRSRSAEHAATSRDRAFEHRTHAGPTW